MQAPPNTPYPARDTGETAAPRDVFVTREAHAGMTMREWLDAAWRGRWFFVGTLLLITLPVAIWAMQQPSQYRAFSVLLVQTKDKDLAAILPSSAGRMMLGEDRTIGNEMLVLRQSLPLAERVAARLISLQRVPGTREPITSIRGADGRILDARTVALRLQGSYLQVQPEGRDVDAVRIVATSTSPGEAALIANHFAEEYLHRTRETSRAGYTASREFLEQQIGTQGQALEGEEAAMGAFMRREGAVNLDQETQQVVGQLSSLEAERDQAAIELQMARATATALRRELDGIEPRLSQRIASGNDRELTAANRRLAQLEGRLEIIYGANPALRDLDEIPATVANPATRAEVTALRERIEAAQGEVRTLSQKLLQETFDAGGINPGNEGSLERLNELRRQLVDATIQANALDAKRAVLTQRMGTYESRLSRVPTQAIELAQRQRARQSTEKLFLGLEEKLQEARVAEQSTLGYAEQVRPALRPSTPFAPNRKRTILLGFLGALGLGLAAAVMRVRLDHRIYIPHDLRETGTPLLGVVPDMNAVVKRDFGGQETLTVEGQQYDTRLTSLLNPQAAASEAFRSVRTSLHFSRPDAALQTIVVTSAMPGEGKSTIASNLAIVLAQTGKRVLLLDADLRKPSLHRKFGRVREVGLSSLLFDHATLDDPAFATTIDDLTLVPAGPGVPNPAELLGSRAMVALIEQARSRFDYVVIDTPPVLMASDALLLSPHADGVVVVVRAAQSKDFELAQMLDQMLATGAPLVGAVLNGYDPRHRLGYGYQYNYMYYNGGYGYTEEKTPASGRRASRRAAAPTDAA